MAKPKYLKSVAQTLVLDLGPTRTLVFASTHGEKVTGSETLPGRFPDSVLLTIPMIECLTGKTEAEIVASSMKPIDPFWLTEEETGRFYRLMDVAQWLQALSTKQRNNVIQLSAIEKQGAKKTKTAG